MDSFALFTIIVVIAAGAVGWSKGLVKQVSQLVGVLLAIVVCRMFGSQVAQMLCGDSPSGTDIALYTVMAYVLLFLVVFLVVWLFGRMLSTAMKVLHISIVNRAGGAVFSVCKWLIFLSLILNMYAAMVPDSSLAESSAYRKVLAFGPWILGSETALQIESSVGSVLKGN